ncbi:hypothetical protein Hamer_G025570 [Homarus americanus]|uniref:Uncharacterized protein n=1 Tax=Homarus americanus TaxID=6706 RepID=A0A8J5MVL3_HOMAM|nr:hypothetical protein Hamer_G025570 [Homarus americanus]
MRSEAGGLIADLEKLETGLMAKMWNRIPIRFNKLSLTLQKERVDLLTSTSLLESLEEFTEKLREKFDEIEDDTKNTMPCINQHYQYEEKRQRKRKRYCDESKSPDEEFTESSGHMLGVQTFTLIIDKLQTCLAQLKEAYRGLADDFAFLKCFPDQNKERLPARVIHLTPKYR